MGESKFNTQEKILNEKLKKQVYKVRMIIKENMMYVKQISSGFRLKKIFKDL